MERGCELVGRIENEDEDGAKGGIRTPGSLRTMD